MIAHAWRCVLLAAALCGLEARAAPFRPVSDDTVVATLPGGLERSAGRRTWPTIARTTADPALLTGLARALIERARAEGDPRDLGRAQALLDRWTDVATTPVEVLVLRATVEQSLHRFDRALLALDAALRREPRNAQALLTRATVLQVQGRLDEAARDCAALARIVDGLVATTCSAAVASLQGRGQQAYVVLDFTLKSAGPGQDRGLLTWSRSVLAGIAERNGDCLAAASHYRAALALDPHDRYLKAAYADHLLDHGDARTALALTADDLADDGLLLRQALARATLVRADRSEAISMLAARHAAARQRSDKTHLREEARFELHLRHDARRALALATANWAVPQREPEDARILLESARAAGDAAGEQVALDWFRRAGVANGYLAHIAIPPPVRVARGDGR